MELCTNACITFCGEESSSLSPIELGDIETTTAAITTGSVTTTVATTIDSTEELTVTEKTTASALPDDDDDSAPADGDASDEDFPSLASMELTRLGETSTTSTTTTLAPTTTDFESVSAFSKAGLQPTFAALLQTETTTNEAPTTTSTEVPTTQAPNVTSDELTKKTGTEVNDRSEEDVQKTKGTKNRPPVPVVRPKPKLESSEEEPLPDSFEDTDLLDFPALVPRGGRKGGEGKGGVKTKSPELELLRNSRRIPAFVPRPSREQLQLRRNGVPGEDKLAVRSTRSKAKSRGARSRSRSSWNPEPLPANRDPGYSDIPVRASRLSHRVIRPTYPTFLRA